MGTTRVNHMQTHTHTHTHTHVLSQVSPCWLVWLGTVVALKYQSNEMPPWAHFHKPQWIVCVYVHVCVCVSVCFCVFLCVVVASVCRCLCFWNLIYHIIFLCCNSVQSFPIYIFKCCSFEYQFSTCWIEIVSQTVRRTDRQTDRQEGWVLSSPILIWRQTEQEEEEEAGVQRVQRHF